MNPRRHGPRVIVRSLLVALLVASSPAAAGGFRDVEPEASPILDSDRRTPGGSAVPAIVGTWIVTVPAGPGPEDDFQALQTFHADGTFTETSTLLPGLIEGPAHGVWERRAGGYDLTFHVLTFEGGVGGAPTGRVRVRCRIRVEDNERFTANSAVDVIAPDGTVIPEVAVGPFSGVRLTVVPR
jgi:hypothetical protein